MKNRLGVAASAVLLGLSGCASIVSDSTYPVSITSTPQGVHYSIRNVKKGNNMMAGVTPATVTLPASNGFFSKASYEVTFEKPGYEPVTYPLKAGMDGWYVGNIVFGGLIGVLLVDPATGAMWKLDDTVKVSLGPNQAAPGDTADVEAPMSKQEDAAHEHSQDGDDKVTLNAATAPSSAK